MAQKIVDDAVSFYEAMISSLTDDMKDAVFENPALEAFFHECFVPLVKTVQADLQTFQHLSAQEPDAPLPVRRVPSYTDEELRALGHHVPYRF